MTSNDATFSREVHSTRFRRMWVFGPGKDWCRDDGIRPVAPEALETAAEAETHGPPWVNLTRDERTRERIHKPTSVTLTRVNPALAGPLPGEGTAAALASMHRGEGLKPGVVSVEMPL
jgi:hypothetical protein